MILLTATSDTQGQRKSDFMHTKEGEVVVFGKECDGDEYVDIDRGCGCRRALMGNQTLRGVTTFKVIDVEGIKNIDDYIYLTAKAMVDAGWHANVQEAWEDAVVDANILLIVSARYPEGTVLERRGGDAEGFKVRRGPAGTTPEPGQLGRKRDRQ